MKRYKVVHRDPRRDVLTLEYVGIARHWTPYHVLTGMDTANFRYGDRIIVIVR